MAGRKAKSRRRQRKKKRTFDGMLSKRERDIAYVDSARFDDDEDERFRRSLCSQFARFGYLTEKQWHAIAKLRGTHERIKKRRKTVNNDAGYFVYAIAAGQSIKIGIARNPDQRAKDIQVGNPEKVEVVVRLPCKTRSEARALEQEIHKDAKRWHIRGEWFAEDVLRLFELGGIPDHI